MGILKLFNQDQLRDCLKSYRREKLKKEFHLGVR